MNLDLPATLELHGERLREFFQGMLVKLHQNAHKRTPETSDIPGMVRMLLDELEEFKVQFRDDRTDPNTVIELFDVANFAYLMFYALRNQGVADWENVGK